MALFTLQELKSIDTSRQFKEIDLPNPDRTVAGTVSVRIRSLYTDEYIDLINSIHDDDGKANWRNKHLGEILVANSWVDESGNLVMKEEDLRLDFWKKASPAFTIDFVSKVREYNSVAADNAVTDMVKNSVETGSTATE